MKKTSRIVLSARMPGGGRLVKLTAEREDMLKAMILAKMAEQQNVTGKRVKEWATELSVKENIAEGGFKASDGWLAKF